MGGSENDVFISYRHRNEMPCLPETKFFPSVSLRTSIAVFLRMT